jgi:hypothetical protein
MAVMLQVTVMAELWHVWKVVRRLSRIVNFSIVWPVVEWPAMAATVVNRIKAVSGKELVAMPEAPKAMAMAGLYIAKMAVMLYSLIVLSLIIMLPWVRQV